MSPTIALPDGGIAIVCIRGGHRLGPCASCGGVATLLCDFPADRPEFGAAPPATCDKALCGRCAIHVGPNRDYCPEHPR